MKGSLVTKSYLTRTDYPATAEEAFSAQRAGILPTCSLHLLSAADKTVQPQLRGSATQELSRVYHATLRVRDLYQYNVLHACTIEL